MTEKLNIVFMGTPDFAVGILDHLVENGMHIVGVVTAPDKPAGRGRKIHTSAIKDYALQKGLTVLQPANLKSEEFLQELQSLQADLSGAVTTPTMCIPLSTRWSKIPTAKSGVPMNTMFSFSVIFDDNMEG